MSVCNTMESQFNDYVRYFLKHYYTNVCQKRPRVWAGYRNSYVASDTALAARRYLYRDMSCWLHATLACQLATIIIITI